MLALSAEGLRGGGRGRPRAPPHDASSDSERPDNHDHYGQSHVRDAAGQLWGDSGRTRRRTARKPLAPACHEHDAQPGDRCPGFMAGAELLLGVEGETAMPVAKQRVTT